MNPVLLTSMAAVSTSVGGYCAVLLQRRVHLLMSFGTGVLVGAALLDLFPSALSAAESSGSSKALVFPIAALGGLLIFCIGEAATRYRAHSVGNRAAGRVSASFLIVHSTLDGTAIFAASTISVKLGLIVGLGVVAHDICDGLNTILLATGAEKPGWTDYGFLALDAVPHVPVAWALGLFSIAFFCQQSWSGLIMTLPADIFPLSAVGTIAGLIGFGGAIGGAIFGLVAGFLLSRGFGYSTLFLIVGTFHLIGFFAILLFAGTVQPLKTRDLYSKVSPI